jgi:hypothetical protein
MAAAAGSRDGIDASPAHHRGGDDGNDRRAGNIAIPRSRLRAA